MSVVVRQLSKAYGLLWALREVSLGFNGGDCVALLGPNGAGKTTLLKLLSALLQPTTGEIEIDGRRLRRNDLRLRSSIGFLYPDGHLYDNLTARENLRFFGALCGKNHDPEAVSRVLDRVGLAGWSDEYVASLSHGMKCRLAIAKSFLLEPRLLLLDEPYGALDGPGVNLLDGYLRGICQAGGTVIVATHNVPRALAICTRALILHQGRIIFDEPRKDPWVSFHRAFAAFLPREEPWRS